MKPSLAFVASLAIFALLSCDGHQPVPPPVIPENHLVAYYPFNGNGNDDSGNGIHGVISEAVFATDRFGNSVSALSFDGVNDFFTAVSTKFSNITSDMSISFWVKTDNFTCLMPAVLANGQGGTGTDFYEFYDYAGLQKFAVGFYKAGGGKTCMMEETVTDNQWHHVVGICQGDTLRIYKDGLFKAKRECGFTVSIDDLSCFFVGGFKTADDVYQYPKGLFDDIRIYKTYLSGKEINDLYHEDGWPL